MKITLKAFAAVKDIVGFDEKGLIVEEDVTIGGLLSQLSVDFSGLDEIRDKLLFAVNEEYRTAEYVLSEGDILAVFPPVSGG